ncbi:type II toxin-antitoxin system RelE/ParE family toxin [Deinococcus sp. SM5_A1]|uniref:type II toxin-antitoxin system RelE/ParE family toxin n=1 Tax=Deinococcus sp. SM5_A1 TaxID=3379094 RepID=UPI00385DD1B4
MLWDTILLAEVTEWYQGLDGNTADLVTAAVDLLADSGPSLGRPLVDTLRGSSLAHLKELRPGSLGRSEVRILFAFNPRRQAILLTAGDKAGQWKAWYVQHIPVAEKRYAQWLASWRRGGDMKAENWKAVRAGAVADGRIDEKRVTELKAAALAQVRAHRLAEVRSASGLTQEELSRRLGISQSRVSRIERGDLEKTELATLRAFVQALGGDIEVTVKLGEERFLIG